MMAVYVETILNIQQDQDGLVLAGVGTVQDGSSNGPTDSPELYSLVRRFTVPNRSHARHTQSLVQEA
jgi:hypothetical protein